MDSGSNQARISSLSDMLLILIISNLPFKEAARTCTLAKRWKNIHHRNTNVVFNESDFVKSSDDEEVESAARVSFVRFMMDWIVKFCGEGIETFQLCFSKPVGFEIEIISLLDFVVSKEVKNLVLDFSDLSWVTRNQAEEESVFELPECVYNQTNLESLKLFACAFNPSRLASSGPMKSLWFGYINLGDNIMTLLSNSLLVESLTLQNCWNVGLEEITRYNNRLREMIIENCEFATLYTNLDLPNLQIFKYIGKVYCFRFQGVNMSSMKEAYLDYGVETEHDGSTTSLLVDLLNDLSSAKKLTVCPFLIQLIQYQEDPIQLQTPMEAKHLVIKTSLKPNELYGVRLMINSCPVLETLTLEIVPHRIVSPAVIDFNPHMFWNEENNAPCLENTLKIVDWKGFSGVPAESELLRYLIKSGAKFERVELRLPSGHHQDMYNWVEYVVGRISGLSEAASTRLWMFINTN